MKRIIAYENINLRLGTFFRAAKNFIYDLDIKDSFNAIDLSLGKRLECERIATWFQDDIAFLLH